MCLDVVVLTLSIIIALEIPHIMCIGVDVVVAGSALLVILLWKNDSI